MFDFDVNLKHPPKQHKRDDNHPFSPKIMTIEHEIIGKMQHNLRA